MIISNSKKYIFVHLIKCGGTSVTHALQKHIAWNDIICGGTEFGESMKAVWGRKWGVGKHSPAREIASLVGKNTWDQYFTFAFVRHPFKRVISRYSYTKKKVDTLGWRRYARHIHDRWDYDLWRWKTVQAYLDTSSFSEYLHHPVMQEVLTNRTQANLLSDEDENLMIYHFGKVENMKSDFEKICDQIGVSAKLSKRNTSKSNYVEYSKEDELLVFDIQKEDYSVFSYSSP